MYVSLPDLLGGLFMVLLAAGWALDIRADTRKRIT